MMYCSNIILTHTPYLRVATNNINLFARIYHVTRRTPTTTKVPLHRFRYQWPSTNASHAGSPKSCRVIQTVVEKEILGNDDHDNHDIGSVFSWVSCWRISICMVYLMCISSIFLCVVVFLQVTDIWAMVTRYLSWEWSYFHTVPNTAKRGQRRSWHKDFQPIAHKIFCKSVSLHNFVSVNIVLIPKPCYLPGWNTSTCTYQSAMWLHPWSATTVSSHRYTFRSVLRRRKECRDTSQQQVTSLYIYDFEIIPTAGTFWVIMFPLVFLLFWNHNMVYMPCFWLIVMAQHMP